MSFTTKENSALGYFFYLTELDPDPHFFGSWIRIHIQKKLLDPDSQKKCGSTALQSTGTLKVKTRLHNA